MRFAYADPPYLGKCGKFYGHNHPDGRCWDDISTHERLIERLVMEYPDGWALSCSSPDLRVMLPLCPPQVRVAAWVKPFCAFKKGVRPAYAWEPVLFDGGRNSNHPPRRRVARRRHRRTTSPCRSRLNGGSPGRSRRRSAAGCSTCSATQTGTRSSTCSPAQQYWDRSWRRGC